MSGHLGGTDEIYGVEALSTGQKVVVCSWSSSPGDFIEDGIDAVTLIRGLNEDWIGFLYCTPHCFHQRHSPGR